MIKIAYVDGKRLSIKNYDKNKHSGKLICAEGHNLIAKCGTIKKHHFCHVSGEGQNCCTSEGKTTWHCWWQDRIKSENLEIRFQKEFLKIADSVNIVGDSMYIIEFQNSKMDKKEMALREKFYTRSDLLSAWNLPYCRSELFWIFNLDGADIEVEHLFGDIICFRWVAGTKYMLHATAPTFLDFGKRDLIQLISVHKIKTNCPYIIGRVVSLENLDKFLFRGILNENNTENRTMKVQMSYPDKSFVFRELRPSIYSGTGHDNSDGLLELCELITKFYFTHLVEKEVVESFLNDI
jgi:hypothetical protein